MSTSNQSMHGLDGHPPHRAPEYVAPKVIRFPGPFIERESRIRFELQVLAVLMVALVVNLLIVLIYSGAI